MSNKSEAIFGLLKRIKEFDSNNFEDRLFAQKICYILQKGFGLDLGYKFKWYVYGPYSSDLATNLYKINDTSNLELIEFKSEENEKIFKTAIDFFKITKPNIDEIELFASILYIRKNCNFDMDETIDALHRRKPKFSKNEIKKAWDKLNENKLLD
jgi:uncharacterized protein YwgA